MFINTQCSEKELALRVKNVKRMATAFSFNVHHKWSLADEFQLGLENVIATSRNDDDISIRTLQMIEHYTERMLSYHAENTLDFYNPIDRAYMRSHGGYNLDIP